MKKNMLAIIGSTRSKSSNLNRIKALAEKSIDIFNIEIFDQIDKLPHFIQTWITNMLQKRL